MSRFPAPRAACFFSVFLLTSILLAPSCCGQAFKKSREYNRPDSYKKFVAAVGAMGANRPANRMMSY